MYLHCFKSSSFRGFILKVKVNFITEQAIEVQRRSRGVTLINFKITQRQAMYLHCFKSSSFRGFILKVKVNFITEQAIEVQRRSRV